MYSLTFLLILFWLVLHLCGLNLVHLFSFKTCDSWMRCVLNFKQAWQIGIKCSTHPDLFHIEHHQSINHLIWHIECTVIFVHCTILIALRKIQVCSFKGKVTGSGHLCLWFLTWRLYSFYYQILLITVSSWPLVFIIHVLFMVWSFLLNSLSGFCCMLFNWCIFCNKTEQLYICSRFKKCEWVMNLVNLDSFTLCVLVKD